MARVFSIAAVGAFALVVATGCSSAVQPTPTASLMPTASSDSSVITTPGAGAPASGESICTAMAEPLVLAAVGEAVAAPQFGDVAGGDGTYCFFAATDDAGTSVEVQFDAMSQAEFNTLAGVLGVEDPTVGVGRSAFSLDRAYTGGPGASVLAWDEGQAATVLIEREGADAAVLIAAAKAIAAKVLADL